MSKIILSLLVLTVLCFASSQAVVWCTTTTYCQNGYRCCYASSLSQYTCCPSAYVCCSGGLKCCSSMNYQALFLPQEETGAGSSSITSFKSAVSSPQGIKVPIPHVQENPQDLQDFVAQNKN